ncbi:MAG: T9SS type A sorting domain-containing protein [Ignavibacteriales bacterium]|nr:T9SS type A sorting domain-containing protein [Ignavibacteriales bacterium]
MISNSWTSIGSVAGNGTTTTPHVYNFVDNNILAGVQQYRLKQVDFDGTFHYSNSIEVAVTFNESGSQPVSFSLDQNYPNPFNPSTTINYSVAKAGQVTVKLYNQLGVEVKELVNEVKAPGKYTVHFNAVGLTSGVYFYKLTSANNSLVKKAILMK